MMSGTKLSSAYRQTKTPATAAHPKTRGKTAAQPGPAQAAVQEATDPQEELLRNFDLNMAYGPVTGLTRLERWERAVKLGKNPPPEVRDILQEVAKHDPRHQCLWAGRI
ncbi:hypothetical protein WJX72_005810 [[Myrmecia] bisecta]|uniref:DNA polymerase delta subunit 4 n=1 Tax=[Myrmecia] bisecta TaxID=41462 RepID=A0AAW1QRY0_9CHLO